MKWKRRSKAYKVQSVDMELEELSKLNEGSTVRVMDRSAERAGEKISTESGLFVPKRDPYDEMLRQRELARDDYGVTKVSAKPIRDDAYRYGKQFAVGEQYLENISYKDSSEESYDEWDYNEETGWDEEEYVAEPESNQEMDAIMQMLQEQQAMEMQKIEAEQPQETVQNSDIETEQTDSAALADMFVQAYAAMDQAEELRRLAKAQAENSSTTTDEINTIPMQEVAAQADVVQNEESEHMKAESEMLAVEETDYDVVRPEILDEIGFTPGGNREPEEKKSKKKLFSWFAKRPKKDEITEEEKQLARQKLKEAAAAKEKEIRKHKKAEPLEAVKDEVSEPKGEFNPMRESRALMMRDPEDRKVYIRKNKEKLAKAKNDFERMEKDYNNLTECLNDMILLQELPDNVAAGVKRAAEQIIRYRKEQKSIGEGSEMDRKQYLLMAENKQELPQTIRRLTEDEVYVARIKAEIDRLEGEKAGCHMEQDDVEDRRRKTVRVSIMVIVAMVVTMGLLLTAQIAFGQNMQIPILLFGICIILVTLGICVQYFKTQTNDTENTYMLNRIIKKQNREKAKYVTALNGVEYVYKKYDVHSSSELLFMWELYQKEYQARESFKNAETETRYYEDRLVRLLQEYGMKNPEIWLNQVEYLVEQYELEMVKEEMAKKRNKLMSRMEKCKRFMGKVESELSVLLIKFPQYAEEIKALLNE